MKVLVKKQLEKPLEETGKLGLLCIDKYEHYHFTDEKGVHQSGDITDLLAWFTKQIMTLEHDGSMQIDFTRFIYYKEYEDELDNLFKKE